MTSREQIGRVIAAEALSWVGTPFAPHSCVKGAGCDCVQLAMGVYKAVGLWPAMASYPSYKLDTGSHLQASQVIGWALDCPWMQPEDKAIIGSAVTFKIARVAHHIGIMISDTKFVHCWRKCGVTEADIRDPTWQSRLVSVWGPKL